LLPGEHATTVSNNNKVPTMTTENTVIDLATNPNSAPETDTMNTETAPTPEVVPEAPKTRSPHIEAIFDVVKSGLAYTQQTLQGQGAKTPLAEAKVRAYQSDDKIKLYFDVPAEEEGEEGTVDEVVIFVGSDSPTAAQVDPSEIIAEKEEAFKRGIGHGLLICAFGMMQCFGSASASDLRMNLGLDSKVARAVIDALLEAKVVTKQGTGPSVRYFPVEGSSLDMPDFSLSSKTRRRKSSKRSSKSGAKAADLNAGVLTRILRYAKVMGSKEGGFAPKDVREKFTLNTATAKVYLDLLLDEKIVDRVGHGRGVKYTWLAPETFEEQAFVQKHAPKAEATEPAKVEEVKAPKAEKPVKLAPVLDDEDDDEDDDFWTDERMEVSTAIEEFLTASDEADFDEIVAFAEEDEEEVSALLERMVEDGIVTVDGDVYAMNDNI